MYFAICRCLPGWRTQPVSHVFHSRWEEDEAGEGWAVTVRAPNACPSILSKMSTPKFVYQCAYCHTSEPVLSTLHISTPSPQFLDKLPGANRLSVMRSLAISPDMFEEFPYDWQQLASLVLVRGGRGAGGGKRVMSD